MICPSCGKENNGAFCTNCGAKLSCSNMFIETAQNPKANILGILGTIFGVFEILGAATGATVWLTTALPIALSLLGLFLAKKNNWKKTVAIVGLCLSVVAFFAMYGNSINKDTAVFSNGSISSKPSSDTIFSEPITIDKQIIYNSNDVAITLTGYEEYATMGPALELQIQNNSSYNLSFQPKYVAINGLMVDFSMYTSVASGKTAVGRLGISEESLNSLGISEIGSIDVLIWAYNEADMYYLFDTGTLHFNTSAGNISQTADFSGSSLFSDKGIEVEYIGKSKDKNGIIIAVENSTDVQYEFEISDISANDCMLDDYSAEYADGNIGTGKILPGSKDIITISINNDDKKKYSITEVSKYEFALVLRPKEDYFSEYKTSPMTVNMK